MRRLSLAVASQLLGVTQVSAAFKADSNTNIAIYWGQNSAGNKASQTRLSTYCSNANVDIIPIAFMPAIVGNKVDFSNAGDNCTTFPNGLLDCPQIGDDIQTCQSMGKTILLSIGGSTYSEGGFTSSTQAVQLADQVWAEFGPVQPGVDRPFGKAVVDGFDFDFESTNSNMQPFVARLRSLSSAAAGKKFYLSAAPQCPFPDAADNAFLSTVAMDFVMVQFYNNYCGASAFVPGATNQTNFNFATWDEWARGSANPKVKVFLGLPASTTAASASSFVSGAQLAAVVAYSKAFASFGGIMLWDMSQTFFVNPRHLGDVVSALGAPGGGTLPSPPTTVGTTIPSSIAGTTQSVVVTTTTTTMMMTLTPTTLATSMTSPASSGLPCPQWAQCGGNGYTGSTVCAPPYTCHRLSEWWSHCQ